MAGYQERPHFLLEFAPGGSKHEEMVVDRPEEEIQTENTSSVVNELPNKVDEFLEVNCITFVQIHWKYLYFQYINRQYFDGELDFTTKARFKKSLDPQNDNSSNKEEASGNTALVSSINSSINQYLIIIESKRDKQSQPVNGSLWMGWNGRGIRRNVKTF